MDPVGKKIPHSSIESASYQASEMAMEKIKEGADYFTEESSALYDYAESLQKVPRKYSFNKSVELAKKYLKSFVDDQPDLHQEIVIKRLKNFVAAVEGNPKLPSEGRLRNKKVIILLLIKHEY